QYLAYRLRTKRQSFHTCAHKRLAFLIECVARNGSEGVQLNLDGLKAGSIIDGEERGVSRQRKIIGSDVQNVFARRKLKTESSGDVADRSFSRILNSRGRDCDSCSRYRFARFNFAHRAFEGSGEWSLGEEREQYEGCKSRHHCLSIGTTPSFRWSP